MGGQEQLQESPWLAKLDVLCSGFPGKKDEGSHGDPEKRELCTSGFRIPPSLNPHPRALPADLVLGLLFE